MDERFKDAVNSSCDVLRVGMTMAALEDGGTEYMAIRTFSVMMATLTMYFTKRKGMTLPQAQDAIFHLIDKCKEGFGEVADMPEVAKMLNTQDDEDDDE